MANEEGSGCGAFPVSQRVPGPGVRFQLLGPPRLTYGTESITVRHRKGEALLWLALLSPNQTVTRQRAALLLWGECPEEASRASLRQALARLRRSLPVWPFRLEQDRVSWSSEAPVRVDLLEFDRAQDMRDVQRAASFCQGPLLEDVSLPDAELFGEWLDGQRRRWETRMLDTLEQAIGISARRPNWAEVESWAGKMVRIQPTHEPAYRWLMMAAVECGDRARALRHFEECTVVLDRELGVPPDATTLHLRERILAQKAPWSTPRISLDSRRPAMTDGQNRPDRALVNQADLRQPEALHRALKQANAAWAPLDAIWQDRALALQGACSDADALPLLLHLAWTDLFVAPRRARQWVDRALALVEADGRLPRWPTWIFLAGLDWLCGDLRASRSRLDPVESHQTGDVSPLWTAHALSILGRVRALAGELEGAHRALDRSRALFEQMSEPLQWASATLALGFVELQRSRPEAAENYLTEYRTYARDASPQAVTTMQSAVRFAAFLRQPLSTVTVSADAVRWSEAPWQAINLLAGPVVLAMQRFAHGDAWEPVPVGLAPLWALPPLRLWLGRLYAGYARMAVAQGAPDQAVYLASMGVEVSRTEGSRYDAALCHEIVGTVALYRHQTAVARRHLGVAARNLDRLGWLADAARVHATLEVGGG